MRQMLDQLVRELVELQASLEPIKSKAAEAKTQAKVNEMTSSGDKAEGAISAFERMEAKADSMLDQANAMEELNQAPKDETAELEKKYESMGATAAVDDDLARLKKEMGVI